MKKTLNSLIILLLLICIKGNAQETYVLGGNNYLNVYKLNSDTTLSFVFDFTMPNGCHDIAISPAGDFYGIIADKLYEIDPSSGNSTLIGALPYIQVNPGLVCSKDFELYSIDGNGRLSKYNILTNIGEHITTIDAAPTGDLTFYKGNIIFQNYLEGKIKAYNIENQSLVTVMCFPKYPAEEIWGNTNVFQNCDSETILAFTDNMKIYELDLTNQTITDWNYDNSSLPVNAFMGAASTSENSGFECTSFQFTDVSCDSVVINVVEAELNSKISIYPNPVNDMLNIDTSLSIDFIEVYDVRGILVEKIFSPNKIINLNRLKNGIYFVKLTINERTITRKVIKQQIH